MSSVKKISYIIFIIVLLYDSVSYSQTLYWEKIVNKYGVSNIACDKSGNIYYTAPNLYKSTDNGTNWVAVYDSTAQFQAFTADSLGRLWASFQDHPGLYYSSDNGQSWNSSPLNNKNIDWIKTDKTGKIFAIRDSSLFYSLNYGQSWDSVKYPFLVQQISTINDKWVVTVLFNGFYLTKNNGQNWTHPYNTNSSPSYCIFGSNETLFLSDGGVIKKSTNYGNDWITLGGNGIYGYLSFDPQNRLYINYGKIYRTDSNATNFQLVGNITFRSSGDLDEIVFKDTKVFCRGVDGLYRTGLNSAPVVKNYLPLAVGNKWQYVTSFGPSLFENMGVDKDSIINNNKYYHICGGINNWVRYDTITNRLYIWNQNTDYLHMDFNLNINSEFLSLPLSYHTSLSEPWNAYVNIDQVTNIFSRLLHCKGIVIGREPANPYKYEYTEKIGITNIYYTYNAGRDYLNFRLIRAIVNDGDSIVKYSDGIKPEIAFTPLLITKTFNNTCLATVTHPYENNSTGFLAIDNIRLESYYSKNDSIIANEPVIAERDIHKACNFTINLDSNLIKSGYEYYYRICAVDKGIIPEFSYKPDTGYYHLQVYATGPYLWRKMSIPMQDEISSFGFASSKIGFATLYKDSDSTKFSLLSTSSGGLLWGLKSFSGLKYPSKIQFIDGNTGYISGIGPNGVRIAQSTNSGTGWDRMIDVNSWGKPVDMHFISNNYGYVLVDSSIGNIIYKTTDGGNSWHIPYQGTIGNNFRKISFVDSLNGWISGSDIKRTTNGGVNWILCNSPNTKINSTYFLNKNCGWSCGNDSLGQGIILKTSDGGLHWSTQYLLSGCELKDIIFVDSLKGWACANEGRVFATNDGGNRWERELVNTMSNLNILYYNDTKLFAGGEPGDLFRRDFYPTDVAENHNIIISGYSLQPNYPNPFNPETNIRFNVPSGSNVKLTVYNSLGQKVKELVNSYKEAGSYEVKFSGKELASGMYIYKLDAVSKDGKKNFSSSRKMLLVK